MALHQSRPEPMNAGTHHPKVKVTITLGSAIFVAGGHVSGKMEMECRADKGLGIDIMAVELSAMQELTSRDHSAATTFLHSRRLFQGPGLPPSNAVQAHPLPGDPPLPQHYHQARRGISTFLFKIPIPFTSPSSISFGSGLAKVRYEVRASVGVFWKGEKRLVTDKRDIEVVESFEEDFGRVEPEGVIVGEYGKIWMQGRVVGGVAVAGETACVELQVKNHSNKKNTGLTITLSRQLVLPTASTSTKSPLQLSDTLTTVSFKAPEYIIPPGVEGVANLVFDVPKHARGVKGGTLQGDESEARTTEAIFEVRCIISVKMGMGLGSKDIQLDLPVQIVHPAALPELPPPGVYTPPPGHYTPPSAYPYSPAPEPIYHEVAPYSPYAYPALPTSPMPAYIDQNHVWLPPPITHTSQPHQYMSPIASPVPTQQYYMLPPPVDLMYHQRPSSAGPSSDAYAYPSGLPPTAAYQPLLPLDVGTQQATDVEEGKGERASRITHHLRLSTRHRSVSPQSHRFPLPPTNPIPVPISPPTSQARLHRNLPIPPPIGTNNLSISPSATSPGGGVVHSPRPLLSPKHSYTVDPATHNSLPKSERVEQLERMADEVGEQTKDLSSGDIPKPSPKGVAAELELDHFMNPNKTLPTPPVPTKGNKKLLSSSPASGGRTRVDTYFAIPAATLAETTPDLLQLPMPSEKTPPTPTLTAVTPFKHGNNDLLSVGGFGRSGAGGISGKGESGLDALERRLLAEVGTRKLDAEDKRPDARSVLMPITIPSKKAPPEPLNDSAISSLTLANEHGYNTDMFDREHEVPEAEVDRGNDSDERTHKAGKSKSSVSLSGGEDREREWDNQLLENDQYRHRERGREGGRNRKGGSARSEKEGDKKGGKKKARDGDGHRMRKSAKGRVAAWLGGIDTDALPPDDLAPPSPSVNIPVSQSPQTTTITLHEDIPAMSKSRSNSPTPTPAIKPSVPLHEVAKGEVPKEEVVASAPNPRSSGFMPIGTFKRDTFQRHRVGQDASVIKEAQRVTDLWSSTPIVKDKSPKFPALNPPAPTRQSIRTNRNISPPSSPPAKADDLTDDGRKALRVLLALPPPSKPAVPPKKNLHAARLPVFPASQQDPEVKYDVRSARGGRGGKVTAVASLWASGAVGETKVKDLPKRLDVPGIQALKPSSPVKSPLLRSLDNLGGLLSTAEVSSPKPPPVPVKSPLLVTKSKSTDSSAPKAVLPHTPAGISSSKPLRTVGKPSATNGYVSSTSNSTAPEAARRRTEYLAPGAESKPVKPARSFTKLSAASSSSSTPEPKLVDWAGKRTRPVIKSSSVPALLSSSHATPTLSSTASLARPPHPSNKTKPVFKLPTTISEAHLDVAKAPSSSTKTTPAKLPTGDLAFGQARLRDLIKKYQGT